MVDTRDYVAFYWNKMDAWYEEDEEVFVHAKGPVQARGRLPTSRRVQVVLNGETLADTARAVLLTETGLPAPLLRPQSDVAPGVLSPSDHVTRCPYKGEAHYYDVTAGGETVENLAWFYRYPTPACAPIANHLCFPQGKVDLYVDGQLEEKPNTRWD